MKVYTILKNIVQSIKNAIAHSDENLQTAKDYTDNTFNTLSGIGQYNIVVTFAYPPQGGSGGYYHGYYRLPMRELYTYSGVTLNSVDNMIGAASPNINKSQLTARIMYGNLLDFYASTSAVAGQTYNLNITVTGSYVGGVILNHFFGRVVTA